MLLGTHETKRNAPHTVVASRFCTANTGIPRAALLSAPVMNQPPETVQTSSVRVSCDGATGIRTMGGYAPSALGHPRVWLEIDEKGFVECPYCDKRFVLDGAAAH